MTYRKKSGAFTKALTWISVICAVLFSGLTLVLNLSQASLGKQSSFVLTLGILLVTGTVAALFGLLAGTINLTRADRSRQSAVVSLLVNGAICSLVFLLLVIGAMQ